VSLADILSKKASNNHHRPVGIIRNNNSKRSVSSIVRALQWILSM